MLEEDCQIILIGLTDEQIRSLPAHIIGISRTENIQQLAVLYSAADVFVNPTHEDNFPTTNIEAIACGTPVITYDTGGSGEMLDKVSGIIVEQGNVIEIKNALSAALHMESDAIRKKAEKYNRRDKYLEYLEIYQKYED